MKKQDIFLLFISLFLMFNLFSQEEIKKDTLKIIKPHSFRIGLDVSNFVQTAFNSDRKAIELVADYQLNKKYFIATEIGFLDKLSEENTYNFNTKGQYIKAGINYNSYKNWLNMDNEIYLGARYGFSTFTQTVLNYTVNSSLDLPETANITPQKFTDLNANWLEFIIGLKAEVYKNLYLGFSLSAKKMLFTKEPSNFKNLYVPGFNRVYLNDVGFGFNYTVSYRFSFTKKNVELKKTLQK